MHLVEILANLAFQKIAHLERKTGQGEIFHWQHETKTQKIIYIRFILNKPLCYMVKIFAPEAMKAK